VRQWQNKRLALVLSAFALIETAISITVESKLLQKRQEKPGWFFRRRKLAAEAVDLSGQEEQPLEETVVKIFRCAKVVKGGRRFSFAALVVLGDRAGTVGIGYGKANEVPLAVEKGIKDAKKSLHKIALLGRTIPHQINGRYRATKITLVPASPGTGVIAGSSARAVLELSGVQNVLTKVYGSTSAKNVVKATLDGLLKLRSKEMTESLRGVEIEAMKRW
jgi:small subunit ribosomal protein S5